MKLHTMPRVLLTGGDEKACLVTAGLRTMAPLSCPICRSRNKGLEEAGHCARLGGKGGSLGSALAEEGEGASWAGALQQPSPLTRPKGSLEEGMGGSERGHRLHSPSPAQVSFFLPGGN